MAKKIRFEPAQRVARLTILREAGRTRDGKVLWLCKCFCGQQKAITGRALKSGRTRSCGCLMRETSARTHRTHGATGTPEYIAWQAMVRRCKDRNQRAFRHYGGRGIKVHPRWSRSFTAFLSDLGPKPSPEHTLERINNEGDYEPGNVKWATRAVQARNHRRNRRVTINGETRLISDWANHFGIILTTVYSRLGKGWNEADALSKPLLRQGHHGPRRRKYAGS